MCREVGHTKTKPYETQKLGTMFRDPDESGKGVYNSSQVLPNLPRSLNDTSTPAIPSTPPTKYKTSAPILDLSKPPFAETA